MNKIFFDLPCVKKLVVLIFEDDAIIYWHLHSLLVSFGFSSKEIHQCADESAFAQHQPLIDLIFLNLKLENGWILESFLISCMKQSRLLILLTGYSSYKPSFYFSDSDLGFLHKPFNELQLKRVLAEYLQ